MIRTFGLAADKRLGQHFLMDPSILARIAQAAGPLAGATVLEIGPGPGGLTRALLAAGAARLVAVERDPRCVRALAELVEASEGRLVVVEGDARTFDPTDLGPPGSLRLVSNLPYNIGSELLVGWLHRPEPFHSMVLMFQKEVAQRLVAPPRSEHYGRLGVLAQTICAVERLFDLPAAAFTPPPKIVSSVVRLTPRPDRPAARLRASLERITAGAFGQRRKMLRTSLGPRAAALLEAAGIDPTRRGETLELHELGRLAQVALQLEEAGG